MKWSFFKMVKDQMTNNLFKIRWTWEDYHLFKKLVITLKDNKDLMML